MIDNAIASSKIDCNEIVESDKFYCVMFSHRSVVWYDNSDTYFFILFYIFFTKFSYFEAFSGLLNWLLALLAQKINNDISK